jgi:ATP-dependent DNA helicase PIF1
VDLIQSGENVFLSGMAGTGKSTALLQYIGQAFRRVDVCATTGIAALNLQDQFRKNAGVGIPAYTIYRWSGMALGPAPGQRFEEYLAFLQKKPMPFSREAAFSRVRAAECLVIDEISMLPGRIIDYLDFHCRSIRKVDRPFGGIQLVAVGDFLQLPPVAKNGRYDWAFVSEAWREAGFQNAYLTQIHRQKEPLFTEALNNFREGRISNAVADTLSSRVKMFVDRSVPRLMTHNAQVDKWNAYQIGEIDSPEVTYEAAFTGPEHEADFLAKNSITPTHLTIKCGARVMATCNMEVQDEKDKTGTPVTVVNGLMGTVKEMELNSVWVLFDNGKTANISQQTSYFDPQRLKEVLNEEGEVITRINTSGSMTQIPLRPAYALTIHKSQGLTLNSAHIDIRAAREPGQAYVALSRLRSLSGLYLKDWIKGVHVSEAAINFYKNLK